MQNAPILVHGRDACRHLSTGGTALDDDDRADDIMTAPMARLPDVTTLREGGEPLLRAIFEGAMDAMVLADDRGVWVRVNPATCELLGVPEHQLLGRNLREFAAGAPEDVNAAWERFREVGQLRGRFALLRPDGSVRQTDFSARADILPGLHLSILRDVTESESAEQALRESRYLLEEAQEVAHIGSWVWNLEADESVYWSNECYRIFGVPIGSVLDVQCFFDRVHPDDRESVQSSVLQAVAQATCYEREHRIVRPNGEQRWVYARAIVERDDRGEPRRMIGVVQDITERRAVMEELRASEQRYRRIIETTSEGVFTIDAQARITFMNQRMGQLLSCTSEAAFGHDICEFLEGDHKACFEQQIWSQQPFQAQHELKLRRGDGAEVWVSLSVNSLLDAAGCCEGALAMATDISERKRAEALRARLLAIVESCDDAILSTDLTGTITSWSQGADRLFGHSAEQALGRSITLLSPRDRGREQLEILQRVAGGEPLRNFETLAVGRDGRALDVSWTVSPINDPSGAVVGAASILRDVSELRRQEQALRKAEEQLLQAQKMEAIGLLAGGVAHDFNNLLSIILSYASLVCESLEPSSALREDVSEIYRAGERAAELTRQLLAFSRRQTLQPEVLDLNQVLAGMEKMLRRLLGEDIALTLALAPRLGNVRADRSQIEQVVLNLAVNAREAMPHGGRLRLELENQVASCDPTQPCGLLNGGGACVQLRVSDTGVGMDEATRARIFEPFFTTKPKGKGTGLGLSTVIGVVQQSGGYVSVTSAPKLGTTVTICLPRSEAPKREVERRPAPANLLGSETILLVEDEEQVRTLAHSVLRRHGYEVLAASNGAEALLIAAHHQGPIELLLTDVIMPLMSGKQLADRLSIQRPNTRVLFMSGYTADAIDQHGVLDPGIHFLAKPLTPAALTQKVRDVLDEAVAAGVPLA